MGRGTEEPLPQLMAGSAAGQLAVARLPPRGLPPQPQGAGGPQTGRPGLLGAQQPGGACLHLPAAQHRGHPACMYSRPPPAAALFLSLCRGRGLRGEVGAKAHRLGRGAERDPAKCQRATQGMGREVAGSLGDRW